MIQFYVALGSMKGYNKPKVFQEFRDIDLLLDVGGGVNEKSISLVFKAMVSMYGVEPK